MADRTVKVTLIAQATGYVQGMEQAARSTRQLGSEAERLAQKREAFETLGRAALGIGISMVAATALAVKSAIDWESAWTGVLKVVEGTPEQLDVLQASLRDMAKELPTSHRELATVAEAAGQLGVKTADVAAFTKVMIDLGATTNLSADEAATSLAQFMNIMGTAGGDVDRLGAAVVALGNNGASTERDIVQMGQRIAGAGKIIGLTEGETLGLANALASVGIEAEAGGSSVSKIMIDIAKAVSSGGDELEKWAQVAGMSADSFAEKFRTKPAEAIATLIEGMGQLNDTGGDLFGTLESLGQTDVRVTRALLSLANGGDLLRNSLNLGNQAWKDNMALQTEAEKRYATTEAQLQILVNRVNDAAINLGTVFLPAVNAVAAGLGDFADMLGGLPEPLQAVIGSAGALAGVIAVVGGVALLAVPKIAQFKIAMDTLSVSTPRAAGALRGMASFLTGPWGVALAAAVVGLQLLTEWTDSLKASSEELSAAVVASKGDIEQLWATAAKGQGLIDLGNNMENIAVISERLGDSGNVPWLFLDQSSGVHQTIGTLKRLGETLGQLASSDLPASQTAFRTLATETDGSRSSLYGLLESMPAYKQALIEQATALGTYSESNSEAEKRNALLAIAMGNTTAAAASNRIQLGSLSAAATDVTGTVGEMADAIASFNEQQFKTDSALLSWRQALVDLDAAMGAEGFTGTLDLNTQEGINNHQMLVRSSELANQYAAQTQALTGDTEAANAILIEQRSKLEAVGIAFGLSGQALQDFINKYVASPKDLEYQAHLIGVEQMEARLNGFIAAYRNQQIPISAVVRMADYGNAAGAIFRGGVKAFAGGGFASGIYPGVWGGIHKFAEKEAGVPWEAYLSGRASDRARNIELWKQTGRMLGAMQPAPASYASLPGSRAAIDPTASGSPRDARSTPGPVELGERTVEALARAVVRANRQLQVDRRGGVVTDG